jgi:hypothetical protein
MERLMKAVLTPSRAAWQNLVRKKSAAADLQALQRKIVELQNDAEKLVRRQPPTFAGGLRLNQVQAQLETCRQALTLATQKVAAEDHKQAQAAIQVEPQGRRPRHDCARTQGTRRKAAQGSRGRPPAHGEQHRCRRHALRRIEEIARRKGVAGGLRQRRQHH